MLDGDGRGDAGNFVDIGFFDALEELPGVGGERFDIAALAFGVDGVEGEAGFSRSGDAGNHSYGVVGDLEADIFEIVDARARNRDGRGLVDGRSRDRGCDLGRLRGDVGLIAHDVHRAPPECCTAGSLRVA